MASSLPSSSAITERIRPAVLTFDGLTFFTRRGVLRSRSDPSPEDGLSARLIALPRWAPSPGQLVRLGLSTRGRIDRARYLLAEGIAHDRAGRASRAQETWRWISDEWVWMTQSSRAARALATDLGSDAAGVSRLQSTILSELLPMLHLQAVTCAPGHMEIAPCHLESLRSFHASPEAPPGLSVAAVLAAAALDQRRQAIPVSLIKPVARAVIEKFLPLQAERALLTRVARGLTRTIGQTDSTASVTRTIESMERIARTAEPNLAVMEVLSLLHTLAATTADWGGANHRLDKALLYDPTNVLAQEYDGQLHRSLRGPGARAWQAPIQHAVVTSSEWTAIQQLYRDAVDRALVERLGLDPEEPRHRLAVAGLVAHLERTRGPRGLVQPPTLEEIGAASPGLDGIDLEPIVSKLETLGSRHVSTLALMLPAREPATCASLAPELGGVESGAPEPPGRHTLLWTWLGSSRDLLLKLAAVAGVVLALHGGFRMAHNGKARSRQDAAYGAFLAATRAKDDPSLIHEGAAFLALPGDQADPRRSQARTLVSEAVLREFARARRDGRTEDGRKLLLAYAEVAR